MILNEQSPLINSGTPTPTPHRIRNPIPIRSAHSRRSPFAIKNCLAPLIMAVSRLSDNDSLQLLSQPNQFYYPAYMYIAPATKLEERDNFASLPCKDQQKQTKASKDNNNIPELGNQLTISEVQFADDMPKATLSPQNKLPRHSHNNSNAANIFRVKHGTNSEKKDKVTYVRYQNYTSARSRKTTEQKIYEINNFVKKLTENINKEDEIPEISDTKFRALKKIIEYYDIKNLDKSEYTNVIKSFGLQIGSVRAESKNFSFSEEKKTEKRFKPITSLLNRTEKQLRARQMLDLSHENSQEENFAVLPIGRVSISERKDKKRQPVAEEKMEQGSKLFNSLQMRKSKLKERSVKKHFKFNSGDNCILEKINKFREFLFVLNFSNRVYRSLDLEEYPQPLKYFVGRGNNSNLIRSLMKKRFWFEEVSNDRQANFVWTQIKVPYIFTKQTPVAESESPSKPAEKKVLFKGVALNKTDPLQKILYPEQFREISMLQEALKNRSIENFEQRLKLCHRHLRKQEILESDTIHNHMPGNGLLGNKKAMFYCMRQYYRLVQQNVFDVVPLTFIINHGLLDPEYNRMSAYFNEKKQQKKPNYWILKPGEFSNRGNGIECTNKLQDIRKRVSKCAKQKKKGSIIVQEYMVKPLLYNGRKFDIRTYMMITYHNGKTKAYWYQQGYVRTSSNFFNLSQISDSYIHLTNDAVQQHSQTYGRFEEGNKLSYPELQRYLDTLPSNGRTLDLHQVIIPQMKNIAANAVKSTFLCLNKERKDKNFELFGLDFMIDQNFKPWLIQINTNPCLELASPVLERILPYMVENLLRITVDTVFPPPDNFSNTYKYNIPQNSLHYNKFELIFDSDRDGKALISLYKGIDIFRDLQGMQQDKSEYKKEGDLINVDDL